MGALLNGKAVREFSIPEQRDLFSNYQSPTAQNPGVSVSHFKVSTAHGEVKTFLYKPESADGEVPFVFYAHGGGWIFGCAADYEVFLFDLVQRTVLAVVFPEYSLAPKKKFPTQHEQCIEVLQYVLRHGSEHGLRVEKVAVAGDSAGC